MDILYMFSGPVFNFKKGQLFTQDKAWGKFSFFFFKHNKISSKTLIKDQFLFSRIQG